MKKYVLLTVVLLVLLILGVLLLRYVGPWKNSQTTTPSPSVSPTLSGSPTSDMVPSAQAATDSAVAAILPREAEEKATEITLTVTQPQDNAVVSLDRLTVRGKTVPNAEIYINDTEGKSDANGNFSLTITLDEGENYIFVTAVDSDGNVADSERYVTYDTEK